MSAVGADVALHARHRVGHVETLDGRAVQAILLHPGKALGQHDVGERGVVAHRIGADGRHASRHRVHAAAQIGRLGVEDGAIARKQGAVHYLVVLRVGGDHERHGRAAAARVVMLRHLIGVAARYHVAHVHHGLEVGVQRQLRKERIAKRVMAERLHVLGNDERRNRRLFKRALTDAHELGVRGERDLGDLGVAKARSANLLDGGGERD